MSLPTMLPFLIPNSPGQRHRPRIGSRVTFSLHDNGTDMNGVTEQSPSLVAGRQPRLQSLSFLPSENQDWRVDSTGPEWPQLQVVQAAVEVLEVKPRAIAVLLKCMSLKLWGHRVLKVTAKAIAPRPCFSLCPHVALALAVLEQRVARFI